MIVIVIIILLINTKLYLVSDIAKSNGASSRSGEHPIHIQHLAIAIKLIKVIIKRS